MFNSRGATRPLSAFTFTILTILLLWARSAEAAEINGWVDIAKITTPSAPPASFARFSVDSVANVINCQNPDSTTCFAVNMSGAAAPTLPATTNFYVIGASSGNSRILGIAYAGTSFVTNARFDGTPASPTAVQSGEQIAGYNAFGYDGTSLSGPLASLRVFANQTFTGSAHGTYADIIITPNGTTTAVASMRFEASGGVTLPSTVTGGDKGVGSLNATALYVNGVAAITAITGGTCTNQFVRAISTAGAITCNTVSLTADVTGTLQVGNGGTGTATAFTQGSVVFAGLSGVYSQDNANFFWDATNHRLGIGTTSPSNPLSVLSSGTGLFQVLTNGHAIIGNGTDQSTFTVYTPNTSAPFQFRNTSNSNNRIGQLTMSSNRAILDLFDENDANLIRFRSDIGQVSFINAGNFLLGGTTDGNYKLDLQKSGSSGTTRFYDQTATTGATQVLIQAGAGDNASTAQILRVANNAATVNAAFSPNGFANKYGGVTTVGWGHPAIYGSGRVTAQTAAAAAIATYTVGAADGTFIVSGNVLVTAAVTASFAMTVTYTDESNTSRTLTLNFSQVNGTLLNTITNVTGTGAYEGVPLQIRCKAATSITFATSGTFTSITYNAEGYIQQIG